MAKKYSPWFKCSEFKPVHVGLYQWKESSRAIIDPDRFDYFDGKYWRTTPDLTFGMKIYDNEFQNVGYWRGLAEESK